MLLLLLWASQVVRGHERSIDVSLFCFVWLHNSHNDYYVPRRCLRLSPFLSLSLCVTSALLLAAERVLLLQSVYRVLRPFSNESCNNNNNKRTRTSSDTHKLLPIAKERKELSLSSLLLGIHKW